MAAPYPSFPANPTIGQTYTDANGAIWTFGNIGWTKTLVSLTSDPSIWQDIDSVLNYDSSGNVTITGGLTTGGKVSIPLGTAPLPSLYFGSDTNTGIYSPGADQVGIATNGTGRLILDASGNVNIDAGTFYVDAVNNRVGIGITGPSSALHVYSTGTEWLGQFGNITANGSNLRVRYNAIGAFAANSVASNLLLNPDGGNVGVGTTGPTFKLDVKMSGSARTDGLVIRRSDNDNHQLGLWTAGGIMYFDAVTDNPSAAGQTIFRRSLDSGSTFNESARIDASGRLLVGTTTTPTAGNWAQYALIKTQGKVGESFGPGILNLARGEAATSITVDENIGGIAFSDQAGNEFGLITCVADAAAGSGDYPGRLEFSVTADGASSPTERMRIRSTGQVNCFSSTTTGFVSQSSQSAGTSAVLYYGLYSATNVTDGTISFVVYSNGNVQNTNNSYGAYSDIKLKENIVDATSQWSDIKSLQIRKYNFKEGQTHTQIGLIAQEVELVSPGLVSESPDRDAEGNDLGTVTKSVNYSVLYMKAVKALQEAMERIETLEAKVAALEAR